MSNPIRVLIVDDHPLMRQAIRTAIIVEPDLQIAGEASNGQEAIERARALQPDVTIMDLLMPGKDGLQAITEIRAENPDARIIVLTSLSEEEPVVAAINAGAQGYLLKDVQRDDLLRAIREVAQGNTFLPPAIARKLIDGIQQSKAKTQTTPVEPLTERERAVLKLIGQGASN
ncbi:partial Response regulator protein VraR, partial [Anaerolineae bacterium]